MSKIWKVLVIVSLIGVAMQMGDLLAKLASGDKLGMGEIDVLRTQLNKTQNIVDIWGANLRGLNPYFPTRAEDAFAINDHPAFKVNMTGSTQSIGNAEYTNIAFTAIETPTGLELGWSVDLTASATNFTVPETGIYVATAMVIWDIDNLGIRELWIIDDMPVTLSSMVSQDAFSNASVRQSVTGLFYWTKGTIINVRVWQNSGSALDISTATFGVFRLRGVQQN